MSSLTERATFGSSSVFCVLGNILEQEVDAIVNAANPSLQGGGGVDGAIHEAAGEILRKLTREGLEKRNMLCLPTGEALATKSGNMKHISFIIHTVGPDCRRKDHRINRREYLTAAYTNTLEEASRLPLVTKIAFPSISTGIYKYPIREAAAVAIRAVKTWCVSHPATTFEIRFVLFSAVDYKIYSETLKKVSQNALPNPNVTE